MVFEIKYRLGQLQPNIADILNEQHQEPNEVKSEKYKSRLNCVKHGSQIVEHIVTDTQFVNSVGRVLAYKTNLIFTC